MVKIRKKENKQRTFGGQGIMVKYKRFTSNDNCTKCGKKLKFFGTFCHDCGRCKNCFGKKCKKVVLQELDA